MAECYRCPHIYIEQRKYGITKHCNLACDRLDVTYYCEDRNKNKENIFCPFTCIHTRFPNIDYHGYEIDFLTVKEK